MHALLILLQASTALRGVTVIDGTGAAPIRNATVIVTGDRISAVGPRASVRIPAGGSHVEPDADTNEVASDR